MERLSSILEKVDKENKKCVSLVEAADAGILHAVKQALDYDLCRFILFGNNKDIEKAAVGVSLDLESEAITVINTTNEGHAAFEAVKTIRDNTADVLMKGNMPTKPLLKAVLNKEFGLRTGSVLSHVALFEIPNQEKLIFLTDAAMNIAPDLTEKVQIINNAVKIANGIGVDCPKVAPIAAVEVINPSMPATLDGAVLTQMQRRGQIKNCIIDGPLAFDNAISKQAAGQKSINSNVAGEADILLVPSIEAGNALYKSFVYFAEAKVAAVISGAKAPIVLTSRADSSENKLYSIALALLSSKTF